MGAKEGRFTLEAGMAPRTSHTHLSSLNEPLYFKMCVYTGKFHVHMYVCVINIHTHIDIIYSICIDYSYSGVELARHGGTVTSPIFYPVSPSAPLTSHTEKSFWVSEGLKPMPALPSWGLSLFQISPSYSLMTPSSPIDYFS